MANKVYLIHRFELHQTENEKPVSVHVLVGIVDSKQLAEAYVDQLWKNNIELYDDIKAITYSYSTEEINSFEMMYNWNLSQAGDHLTFTINNGKLRELADKHNCTREHVLATWYEVWCRDDDDELTTEEIWDITDGLLDEENK